MNKRVENLLLLHNCKDLPVSNTTVNVDEDGDGDAELDGDYADTDDNNFEMELRRRKGKIINCAKETIEQGKYYNSKYK